MLRLGLGQRRPHERLGIDERQVGLVEFGKGFACGHGSSYSRRSLIVIDAHRTGRERADAHDGPVLEHAQRFRLDELARSSMTP